MPTTVPCPVCGSPARAQGRQVYSASDAATHHCFPQRDPERHARLAACIRRLWGQDSVEILWCPSCGFGFANPYVGGDAEFYSIIHEDFGYPTNRWEYGHAIASIISRFPAGGKIIDVGTGDGAFLDRLPPSWTKAAIESTDTMREVLRRKNILSFSSPDTAAEALGPHSCNVVTLFQCLEHVRDFHPMLSGLRHLMAPGGLLIVSVPNGDDIPRRERATLNPDMPPNHVNKWTRQSLSIAFERSGFKLHHAEVEAPGWRHLPYSVYLRVRTDAALHPRSLAGRAYGVRDRTKRARLLRLAGLLTAPKVLPHLKDACLSTNFMVLGEPA